MDRGAVAIRRGRSQPDLDQARYGRAHAGGRLAGLSWPLGLLRQSSPPTGSSLPLKCRMSAADGTSASERRVAEIVEQDADRRTGCGEMVAECRRDRAYGSGESRLGMGRGYRSYGIIAESRSHRLPDNC